MMNLRAELNKLCRPAYLYFVISVFTLLLLVIQNLGNNNRYCLGSFSCVTSNKNGILVFKFLHILFWTWMLNMLCNNGYKKLSMGLFALPYVLLGLVIVGDILHKNRLL